MMSSVMMKTLLALVLVAGVAWAQDAEPVAPAESEPAVSEQEGEQRLLRGRIVVVKGLVQVKQNEGDAWQPAKPGMEVNQGSEFRTGPRSAVQFIIEGGHVITLDRLGTMKVVTAVEQANGKIKTDMGMKYGRTSYKIETGGKEHESAVRSPGATLAVRGTEIVVQSDAMGTWHKVVESIGYSYMDGKFNEILAANEMTDEDEDPADFKWWESLNNPEGFFGQDDVDNQLAQLLQGLGGLQIDDLDPRIERDLRRAIALKNQIVQDPDTVFADITTTLSKLTVEVFDGGIIDGDILDVRFNESTLATGLTLTRPGDIFMLNLDPGLNVFTIVGKDEGAIADISGAIDVKETGDEFEFEMTGDMDERSIVIRRVSEGAPE